MWLNQLFMDTPIDFEKRCRRRIAISAGLVVLGAVSILIVLLTQGQIPVLYLEPNTRDFIPGFLYRTWRRSYWGRNHIDPKEPKVFEESGRKEETENHGNRRAEPDAGAAVLGLCRVFHVSSSLRGNSYRRIYQRYSGKGAAGGRSCLWAAAFRISVNAAACHVNRSQCSQNE